jgi:hypothetical protein
VLDLGRALVKELGADQGVDTLSRWMAHYIAELIETAEAATDELRSDKLSKCADAILDLWRHRHEFANGKGPFEDMEPILRALQSLDPNDDTPRYFRSHRNGVGKMEQNSGSKKWLELADGLDYSAKSLIRYCLIQAAQPGLDNSKNWAELAETAGLEEAVELPLIRFITAESDLTKTNATDEMERKLLEDRLKKLEAFKKMANCLASDLRRQLKNINGGKI